MRNKSSGFTFLEALAMTLALGLFLALAMIQRMKTKVLTPSQERGSVDYDLGADDPATTH